MPTFLRAAVSVLLFASGAFVVLADDDPPAETGTLVVVDAAGKEQKIKSWSFTAGLRPLSWLAAEGKEVEGKGKAKDKKVDGPQALVVRDELKIHFLAGVVTLVPVEKVRAITFDKDKETMTVRVAVSAKPEEDVVLTGTTAYRGINKLTLKTEVDKGELGVAEVTFEGGIPKGIQGLRFAKPNVEAAKPGRPAVVTTADRDVKTSHQVSDLLALYQLKSGKEVVSPLLMFRKTLKIDVAKVKKIAATSEESDDVVWQVVLKDGDDSTLTLLTTVQMEGQSGTLIGLLGKVPAGYKLIPVKRVSSIEFDKTLPKKGDLIDTE